MLPEPSVPEPFAAPAPLTRTRAGLEVLICSGYPTQLGIAAALAAVGILPGHAGALSPLFIFAVSAIDTVVLLGLIVLFLRLSGDRPRAVFLGVRRIPDELVYGVLTVPLVFLLVLAVQVSVRLAAPFLHNVEVSPFLPLLASPTLLAGFIVLVLVAGGLREELQRAFLLHRFEQRLGGGRIGVIVTSIMFGLGHVMQGWDAAIVTGLLGAFWGVVYLSRRSVAATVTSHALFNVAQIALGYATLARA